MTVGGLAVTLLAAPQVRRPQPPTEAKSRIPGKKGAAQTDDDHSVAPGQFTAICRCAAVPGPLLLSWTLQSPCPVRLARSIAVPEGWQLTLSLQRLPVLALDRIPLAD